MASIARRPAACAIAALLALSLAADAGAAVTVTVKVQGDDGSRIRAKVTMLMDEEPQAEKTSGTDGIASFTPSVCTSRVTFRISYGGRSYTVPTKFKTPVPCRQPVIQFTLASVNQ